MHFNSEKDRYIPLMLNCLKIINQISTKAWNTLSGSITVN